MTNLLWHYTIPSLIEAIFYSKKLIPRWCTFDGKPILWFSANQDWEKSALQSEQLRTRNEMVEAYGSLFRIGLHPDQKLLEPWTSLQRTAQLSSGSISYLETSAQKLGANHSDWWGTTSSVSISEWRSVEKIVDDKWKELMWWPLFPNH